MNRRMFVKSSLTAAALTGMGHLMSGCGGSNAAKRAASIRDGSVGRRPNIIFILADDMGYGDIGYFGNPKVDTPNLDRLASEGICLTQHYSASPVCAPARASLLTGMYPPRTGQLMSYRWQGISPQCRTMGHYFAEAGYKTALVGKWHLEGFENNWQWQDNQPEKMGFQEVVKAPAFCDYWDWQLWKDGQPLKPDGRYITDVLTDEAVDYIERHKNHPFFLYLSYTAPHFPLQSRPEDADFFRNKGGYTEGQAITYGMIRRQDYGVGRVMETLQNLGLSDNTLVVFVSDNGPFLAMQDGLDQNRYNAHLLYGKGIVNEGGIRVPAIVRWPDGLGKTPRICRDFNHFVDWLPTLLAAADIPCPPRPQIDGENLLPVLRGQKERTGIARFWAWSWSGNRIDSNAAMRDGDWKLVRPFQTEKSGCCPNPPLPEDQMPASLPSQLYNLEIDPSENNDLASLFPDRVRRMENELQAWFDSVMSDFENASRAFTLQK